MGRPPSDSWDQGISYASGLDRLDGRGAARERIFDSEAEMGSRSMEFELLIGGYSSGIIARIKVIRVK
jgi:hypothetical protein